MKRGKEDQAVKGGPVWLNFLACLDLDGPTGQAITGGTSRLHSTVNLAAAECYKQSPFIDCFQCQLLLNSLPAIIRANNSIDIIGAGVLCRDGQSIEDGNLVASLFERDSRRQSECATSDNEYRKVVGVKCHGVNDGGCRWNSCCVTCEYGFKSSDNSNDSKDYYHVDSGAGKE